MTQKKGAGEGMKNTKRLVTLLLAAAMVLSIMTVGCATESQPKFEDVPAGTWYTEAVEYCREKGLMSGTSGGRFEPGSTMTRAMLVTALYRQAGEPAVTGTDGFSDTEEDTWYSKAVLWASQEGLVSGYGNGLFGTGDPVAREQIVTILWRMAGSPGAEEGGAFTDQDRISPYAVAAVAWAREKGIVSGRDGDRFDPQGEATRAEVAVILSNQAKQGETVPEPMPSLSTSPSGAGGSGGGSGPAPVQDDLVLIQGGTFQMGSPADEPERSSDEVQHRVSVGSFYMAKTEVSQREYQNMMGSNPSETRGDDLPVTNLTWYDAIRYCNKRSEAEGLTPCYTIEGATVTWNRAANGYRLPTEAEWEHAARANTATPFSFGDDVHNSDANCYNAYGYNNDASGSWVNGSGAYLRRTVAVDAYAANPYGLYNMHGNAAEWVWDWYGVYGSGTASDPTGPEGGNAKVVRGGGWNDHPKHIRSAYRGAQPADVGLYSIGVRPVRNAEAGSGRVRSEYTAVAGTETGKTLIVYFSQTGNTEGLAKLIQEMSGADIFRLERATPYSSSSNGPVLYGEALDELRSEALPELKACPDIDRYDTILLGYCNWWSSVPAAVRTLLTRADFSGKTIVPFCSMGGGRFGQTISAIAKLAPNSVIREGLEVTYSFYDREEIAAWLERSLPAAPGPDPDPDPEPAGAHVLVAYFSATNNTENIANHIKAAFGEEADLYEIVPETPYSSADLNYNNDSSRANREQSDASARPAITGMVANMGQYDVVFLGYPIWHGQAPKILYTFAESYDLAGKTVVPFCTSGSSPVGSSATNLAAVTDGASWLSGRRFSGSADQAAVESWIDSLELPEAAQGQTETARLYLQVSGGKEALWTATLAENSSAEALKELLKGGPLTIEMSDYGSMEKVGPIGRSLPTNNQQITTNAGDIILYQGDRLVIYYDRNSWNFTRLGKVDEVTQAEMKEVLGTGGVTVTLSLTAPGA